MPLSEIGWHMDNTIKLIDAQRAARARDNDDE
jgi:hypothetical protein